MKTDDRVLIEGRVLSLTIPDSNYVFVGFEGGMVHLHRSLVTPIPEFQNGEPVECTVYDSWDHRAPVEQIYGAYINGQHYCYIANGNECLKPWPHVRKPQRTITIELTEDIVDMAKIVSASVNFTTTAHNLAQAIVKGQQEGEQG